MHKTARCVGYPSDSSRAVRQRSRGTQAQLAGARPLPPPSPTADLRRRSTPSPPPPHPATRLGAVPPGRAIIGSGPGGCSPPSPHPAAAGPGAARTGRLRSRPGRAHTTATAPGRSCGRDRCHALGPGGSGRVGQTPRTGTNTGRRASPARPGPWRPPGLLTVCWIAGAFRRCHPGLSRRGSRSGAFAGPVPLCVDRRGLRHWGRRARSARPRTTGRHPGYTPALWIADPYLHRGPGASRRRRTVGRTRASASACGSPGATSLWGRRARAARPRTTGCYSGHPPARWITGTPPRARRQSPRAVRSGVSGPPPPRVDRRVLRSQHGRRSASLRSAVQSARTEHRSSWAGQRAGPGQHRGPPPVGDPDGNHRARALSHASAGGGTHRARAPHHQSAGGGTHGPRAQYHRQDSDCGPGGRTGAATTSDSVHPRGLSRRAVIAQGGRVTPHASRLFGPRTVTGRAGGIRDSENPAFPSDQNKQQRLAACAPDALSFQARWPTCAWIHVMFIRPRTLCGRTVAPGGLVFGQIFVGYLLPILLAGRWVF